MKLDYFICVYYWLGLYMQPKLALNTTRICPQNIKLLKQKEVTVCCGIFKNKSVTVINSNSFYLKLLRLFKLTEMLL